MNDADDVIKVVVAEDDFFVAKEIERTLSQAGLVKIGSAADGEEAVDVVCRLKPDVVLMDIKMPRLDGLEAAAKIRELCPTPIVILTAHESPEFFARASAAGVGAYITKPPHAGHLASAVSIARARFEDLRKLEKLTEQLEARNAELQRALERVETLEGILPICAGCKKIRDKEERWIDVEVYLRTHTRAEFSHGLCPHCAERMYGDFNE